MHKHKHKWVPYMLGSQVCSICGVNRVDADPKYRRKIDRQFFARHGFSSMY
ncbi:MAG: hypothetical protein ABI337_01575 [Nitrososphaera sp.]